MIISRAYSQQFLLHLLDQEEGERSGNPGADGMRGHPPPGAVGSRVHALPALQIQQGVAFTLVLSQERCHRPLAGVYRALNRRGPIFMEEVGCPEEGQKEDLDVRSMP